MSDLPTPGAVLDYWIGPATHDHLAANRLHKRWFIKSAETDAFIKAQFGNLLDALGSDLADTWLKAGARQTLAAIIVLDQFSRNLHRGTPKSFAFDELALRLAKTSLERGDGAQLTEVERSFLLMPLEHSEALIDQHACVRAFETLAASSRACFQPLIMNSLDYARQHQKVIEQFGRFPHRNAILGRENTAAEADYLKQPGSGF
ncbi:MAG: DUF924 family protein [Pseudomonadota bacterium]